MEINEIDSERLGSLCRADVTDRHSQDAFLSHWKEKAERLFGDATRQCLHMGTDCSGGIRRWLCEPVVFTWKQRNNLFRGVLMCSTASVGDTHRNRHQLAACTEIAWTCALIVDDIMDASVEREGHVAAHLEFGLYRCLTAVMLALANVGWKLLLSISGSCQSRIERLKLATRFLLRCAMTQLPSKYPDFLAGYRSYAIDTNICLHWILLAPYCGQHNGKMESLMREFADRMALAGRISNDLHDYWGGASERQRLFNDFHSRKKTYPILVLLEQNMMHPDRVRVEYHFSRRDTLRPDQIMEMFRAYDVARICLDDLSRELAEVSEVLGKMKQGGLDVELEESLAELIHFTGAACRERLSAAIFKE